jgi:hypothetical protein
VESSNVGRPFPETGSDIDLSPANCSEAEWCHCPVAPLYITYMSLAGIRPIEPGFKRCEIRPQLADLELLELTAHTVQGAVDFTAHGRKGEREVTIGLPASCAGELVVKEEEALKLLPATGPARAGIGATNCQPEKERRCGSSIPSTVLTNVGLYARLARLRMARASLSRESLLKGINSED